MAKTASRPLPADDLRKKLDALAIQLVDKAMNDDKATVRTLSDALKVAGGYYQLSRSGNDGAPEESAWDQYGKSFIKDAANAAPN
jgi:hypothetical protein